MNKKGSTLFIIGVVVVVLIIGIFSYFAFFQEEKNIQEQSEQDSGISQNEQSQICVEDWGCSEWSECADSQQTRTCTDLNSCGTIENKPSETQDCTEEIAQCSENWNCEDWSNCENEIQTRICTDSNNCGTSNNKPSVSQTCEEETKVCGDSLCTFPEENMYSCWEDCKPEFNTNEFKDYPEYYVDPPSKKLLCSESTIEINCCSGNTYYTHYTAYYTCDYVEGLCDYEFDLIGFCKNKSSQAGMGFLEEDVSVATWKLDLNTGEEVQDITFIQCDSKLCE